MAIISIASIVSIITINTIPAAEAGEPGRREITNKARANARALLFLGGDDLLSHFRSTIGAVRFNFSVRNGKRWSPHAVITLMSFDISPFF